MIVAIQTARAGSKSVPDKNISIVDEKPLFRHPLDKVKRSRFVEKIYISTDCKTIADFATLDKDVELIRRPKILSGDLSSHHDVMIHAIQEIEKTTSRKVEIAIILLGNSLGSSSESIDLCIKKMLSDSKISGIQSVSKFNMFNPYRAFKIQDKNLKTFLDVPENTNDKNSAGDIYFFNGSFCMCRRDILMSKKGSDPFPWCGYKIVPFIEKTKMEVDDHWQLDFLRS